MSKNPYLVASILLLAACTDVEVSPVLAKAGDEANFGAAEDHLF